MATTQRQFRVRVQATPSIFEPEILNEPQGELFATVDDGGADSPSYASWHGRLNVPWRNVNTGDFTDANGVAQGSSPFARTSVPTDNTTYTFDVAALIDRALTTGKNKGLYLRASGTSPSVPMDGRLGAIPPTLSVTTSAGTFACACLCTAAWGVPPATSGPSDGRTTFRVASNRYAIVRFDLSGVTGTVQTATMSLRVNDRSGTNVDVEVFEANPPEFIIGCGDLTPVQGLAAEVGENNLAAADGTPLHPDVISAGHFGDTQFLTDSRGRYAVAPRINGFSRITFDNTAEVLPDPDAPGTHYWRGECVNVQPGGANRSILIARKSFMLPDLGDPQFPVDMSTHVNELFVRCYFMYETDFLDRTEGIKMGLSLDTRLGYWVTDASRPEGGYWQNDGGSSNSYGDGMAHLGDCHDNDGSMYSSSYYSHTDRNVWTYKGNMQWNQGGYTGEPGAANWDIRPLRRYDYSIDMPNGVYTDGQSPLNNLVEAKVRLGHWYCLERHMRLNTLDTSQPLYGLKDGSFHGNYEANADGLMETWLNGVLVDRRVDYRWRRHPHIGIRSAGMEWYVGGNGTTNWPAPMHLRVSHVVIARRYIGPRVRP